MIIRTLAVVSALSFVACSDEADIAGGNDRKGEMTKKAPAAALGGESRPQPEVSDPSAQGLETELEGPAAGEPEGAPPPPATTTEKVQGITLSFALNGVSELCFDLDKGTVRHNLQKGLNHDVTVAVKTVSGASCDVRLLNGEEKPLTCASWSGINAIKAQQGGIAVRSPGGGINQYIANLVGSKQEGRVSCMTYDGYSKMNEAVDPRASLANAASIYKAGAGAHFDASLMIE